MLSRAGLALAFSVCLFSQPKPVRPPDVRYEPSSPEIVKRMLELGGVRKGDVLYDLGCGDGRIVIAAAKQYGIRGVGIDIDPQRILEANANAKAAGVTKLVKFRVGDLFESDVREATIVTLYLWPWINLKLRPILLRQLKPGSRIVSHYHDMGDWPPEKQIEVEGHQIYLWTVPPQPR
ncbi:MAG: methyltransferase domain-containing protein [Bryobacteraceae bacterium]|nr:methyltransferase domain-containing protein [Bryobacteraceae bacterium]